jgi:hypothetical protein
MKTAMSSQAKGISAALLAAAGLILTSGSAPAKPAAGLEIS